VSKGTTTTRRLENMRKSVVKKQAQGRSPEMQALLGVFDYGPRGASTNPIEVCREKFRERLETCLDELSAEWVAAGMGKALSVKIEVMVIDEDKQGLAWSSMGGVSRCKP
jgi:hypothetical protein